MDVESLSRPPGMDGDFGRPRMFSPNQKHITNVKPLYADYGDLVTVPSTSPRILFVHIAWGLRDHNARKEV